MSKEKIKNSIWVILFEGIKIYFTNMDKFFVYMLFPVFGQIIGIGLTFALTLGFADRVAQKTDSVSSSLLLIILLALPGLLVFMKAFWDYMVAYVSLNSMTEGAITTGRVYDFQSHNQVATKRSFKYISLLLAVGILSLSAVFCCIIPIFGLIPPLILWIYFILVFQVFTFEDDLSVKECFKKSFELIKGDWGRTFLLMFLLAFFSVYIITEGTTVIFDYLRLTDVLASKFDFIGNAMPLDFMNKALAYANVKYKITVNYISLMVFTSLLCLIVTELTLPVRSICYTLWYKNLSAIKDNKIQNEKVKKYRKKLKKDKSEE